MPIYVIIANILTVAWILPPFTQVKGRYFYFFYIVALSAISGFANYIFHFGGAQHVYLATTVLFLPSLFKTHMHKNFIYYLTLGVITYFISNTFLSKSTPYFFELVIFIPTFIIVLSRIIKFIFDENKILIFECVLGLYLFSLIIKYIPLISEGESALVFYFLMTFFQIIIGVFFIFANEDNPKLTFNLPVSFLK